MPSKLLLSATSSKPLFHLLVSGKLSRVPPRDLALDQIQVQGIKKHILFERMSLVECDNKCSKLGTEGLF